MSVKDAIAGLALELSLKQKWAVMRKKRRKSDGVRREASRQGRADTGESGRRAGARNDQCVVRPRPPDTTTTTPHDLEHTDVSGSTLANGFCLLTRQFLTYTKHALE